METPDGPWSWCVLAASMVTYAVTLGFPSAIGIFYTDLQNSFNATNQETSWFPSIITAVLHAGGPLCSIMVERFGCRITVMVGGLLCGIGLVASSFSQNIIHLYLSAGIVGGLGLSLSFQASVTVLGYYFIKRRTLANALAATGASIGMALWPLISQYLLETMGWRGSFMIFGGIFLNCCVCGAVMRPVKAPPAAPGKDASSSMQNGTSGGVTELEQRKGIQRYMAFDLLLRHRRYQIYTIGVTWMVLGFVLPLFYLVPYATSNGIEEKTGALLLSLIGFVNIFARPVAGIVSQHKRFSGKRIYLFSGAVVLNGLSNLVCAASASFSSLVVYCGLYGVSMSVIGALVFNVLMEIVGMKRFPGAFGLFTILESVTLLIGPPLAEAKEQVLANLANFSYDPKNFSDLQKLQVPDLFLDMLTEDNENLVEFGIGGICNLCLDKVMKNHILSSGGLSLIINCLSSCREETVLSATTTLMYLCTTASRAEIITPPVVECMVRFSLSDNRRFSNLAKIFLEDYCTEQQVEQARSLNQHTALGIPLPKD